MATTINYRAWLAGAAIGLLLALLILPATSSLLRLQIEQVLSFSSHPFDDRTPTSASIAASRPNDFQIQLSVAQNEYLTNEATVAGSLPITSFISLNNRFPNNPSAYANELRILCMRGLVSDRPEDYLMSGQIPHPHQSLAQGQPGFPYAFYDHTAAVGEQIDPQNAYFPLMRAVALYGQNKDAAAMAEVHKASLKPYWREYYSDDVYGSWKIASVRMGAHSAIMLLACYESVLYPHYARLRQISRIELYKAMMAERGGDFHRGLEIRMDILRYGSLMRQQSPNIIGSLVGIAIVDIATQNIKGQIESSKYTGLDNSKVAQARLDAFYAYLRQTGNSVLISPVEQEFNAGTSIRKSGLLEPITNMSDLARDAYLWVTGSLLLENIVMLLVFGTAALAALRIFKLKDPRPILPMYRLPVIVGLVVGVTLSILQPGVWDAITICCLCASVVALTYLTAVKIFQRKSHSWRQQAFSLLTVAGVAIPILAVVRICEWQEEKLTGILVLFSGAGGVMTDRLLMWALLALMFFIPGLLIIVASFITSLIRKVPIYNGILIGVAKTAFPMASVLILIYGVVFLKTVTQERVLTSQVQQMAISEGQYCANVTGHPWPSPTDWGVARTNR